MLNNSFTYNEQIIIGALLLATVDTIRSSRRVNSTIHSMIPTLAIPAIYSLAQTATAKYVLNPIFEYVAIEIDSLH